MAPTHRDDEVRRGFLKEEKHNFNKEKLLK